MAFLFPFPNQIQDLFEISLQDQRRGEVCLSFIKWKTKNNFSWFDKPTMNEEIKKWRKLAKQGKVKICKYNNMNFEYKGKTYYTLVIQFYKNEKMNENWCVMLAGVFGIWLKGTGYCFRTQQNRDNIYNYVMKDISEPIKDKLPYCLREEYLNP